MLAGPVKAGYAQVRNNTPRAFCFCGQDTRKRGGITRHVRFVFVGRTCTSQASRAAPGATCSTSRGARAWAARPSRRTRLLLSTPRACACCLIHPSCLCLCLLLLSTPPSSCLLLALPRAHCPSPLPPRVRCSPPLLPRAYCLFCPVPTALHPSPLIPVALHPSRQETNTRGDKQRAHSRFATAQTAR